MALYTIPNGLESHVQHITWCRVEGLHGGHPECFEEIPPFNRNASARTEIEVHTCRRTLTLSVCPLNVTDGPPAFGVAPPSGNGMLCALIKCLRLQMAEDTGYAWGN